MFVYGYHGYCVCQNTQERVNVTKSGRMNGYINMRGGRFYFENRFMTAKTILHIDLFENIFSSCVISVDEQINLWHLRTKKRYFLLIKNAFKRRFSLTCIKMYIFITPLSFLNAFLLMPFREILIFMSKMKILFEFWAVHMIYAPVKSFIYCRYKILMDSVVAISIKYNWLWPFVPS